MMYKSYTMNDELKKCRDVSCFALNDVHNHDNNDQITHDNANMTIMIRLHMIRST